MFYANGEMLFCYSLLRAFNGIRDATILLQPFVIFAQHDLLQTEHNSVFTQHHFIFAKCGLALNSKF